MVDKVDGYSMDSYFFAYFQDLPTALEQIRSAVRQTRGTSEEATPSPLIDTTVTRSPISYSPPERPQTLPSAEPLPSSRSTGFRLTSLLRPLEALPLGRTFSAPEQQTDNSEDFTYITKRGGFVPGTTSPKGSVLSETTVQSPVSIAQLARPPLTTETSSSSVTPTASYISNHTYPPSTSPSPSTSQIGSNPSREAVSSSSTTSWSVGVPSWFRIPTRRVFGSPLSPSSSTLNKSVSSSGVHEQTGGMGLGLGLGLGSGSGTVPTSASGANVSEVVTSNLSPSNSRFGDFGFFSILEKPSTMLDLETVEKFRTSFAFDEKEVLLGREWHLHTPSSYGYRSFC